jgi:hypothetical protein
MRRILLALSFVSLAIPALGQEAKAPTARLCVAQLRNRAATNFDVVKLRQLLMDGLSQTRLAKTGSLSIVPIEVGESEDAQAAVQSQSCDFAVYTRLLQQAPVEPSNVDVSGEIRYRSSRVEPTQFLMGVQCTVERTGNSIPALIDRQFTKTPGKPQSGIEKILTAEAQRIADAIEKKLSFTPK